MVGLSIETRIVAFMSKLVAEVGTRLDKKDNKEAMLAEAFLWDTVKKYATNKSEAAWKRLQKEQVVPEKEEIEPGATLEGTVSSTHFSVNIKATQKVRRFDVEELCNLFKKSKYKVPVSVTAELCEAAKVPTSAQVSFKVLERGSAGAF